MLESHGGRAETGEYLGREYLSSLRSVLEKDAIKQQMERQCRSQTWYVVFAVGLVLSRHSASAWLWRARSWNCQSFKFASTYKYSSTSLHCVPISCTSTPELLDIYVIVADYPDITTSSILIQRTWLNWQYLTFSMNQYQVFVDCQTVISLVVTVHTLIWQSW